MFGLTTTVLLALHDCDKQARKPKLTAEASMETDLLFILEHGFSQKGTWVTRVTSAT